MINRNADIKRPPSRQDTKESPSRRQGHLAGSERNRFGPLKPEKKLAPAFCLASYWLESIADGRDCVWNSWNTGREGGRKSIARRFSLFRFGHVSINTSRFDSETSICLWAGDFSSCRWN